MNGAQPKMGSLGLSASTRAGSSARVGFAPSLPLQAAAGLTQSALANSYWLAQVARGLTAKLRGGHEMPDQHFNRLIRIAGNCDFHSWPVLVGALALKLLRSQGRRADNPSRWGGTYVRAKLTDSGCRGCPRG